MLPDIDLAAAVVAVVIGYLVGSVPVAVLVARGRGFDPRDVGDRNPGYWNMKEQLGSRGALPVFVGDVTKGVVAGGVGVALDGSAWGIAYAAVGAAMVGHALPVFARFRGGRSVLTFVGGAFVLSPAAATLVLVLVALVWVAMRSFVVAARVGVFGFPAVQLGFESKERVAATGSLLTIIGIRFLQAWHRERSATGPDQS